MIDFVHQSALLHLSTTETRLSNLLARPQPVAAVCVLTLAATGWLALGLLAAGPEWWQALCRPAAAGGWSGLAVALPMWAAMALAMMLPTAGPMILTYAEIADTAARKREPVVSPLVLVAGYIAVWLGFALVVSVAQALMPLALFDIQRGTVFAGAILAGAGLYQFSSLKRACLTLCQRPFPFFFTRWTNEPRGVFRLGLLQGLYCLGCCWAMMLALFAVGAMNAVWMAALGVVMTVEKMTATPRFARAVGLAFVAGGLWLMMSELV